MNFVTVFEFNYIFAFLINLNGIVVEIRFGFDFIVT